MKALMIRAPKQKTEEKENIAITASASKRTNLKSDARIGKPRTRDKAIVKWMNDENVQLLEYVRENLASFEVGIPLLRATYCLLICSV